MDKSYIVLLFSELIREEFLMTVRKSLCSLGKIILLTAFCLALSPIAANSQVCGDVNGNGLGGNVGDFTYLLNYFFKGGPPPVDMSVADFDGYLNLRHWRPII